MTFEDWQASKRQVDVADTDLEGYCFAEDTEQCWLYAGGLVIESRPGGKFLLQLPEEEEVSDDIERLERRLYEFGLESGEIP